MENEQIKSKEEIFAKASAGKYIFGSTDIQVAKDMHNIVYAAMEEYAQSRLSVLETENKELSLAAERAFYVAKKYDTGKYAHILDKVEKTLELAEQTINN